LSETGKVLERPTILMFKKNTTDNTTSDCPRNAASQPLELRDVHTHGRYSIAADPYEFVYQEQYNKIQFHNPSTPM
jgi:hypothetical protein